MSLGWTHTRPHKRLPAQLPVTLIATHCLQSPSAEVLMAAETELGYVDGGASTVWTCLLCLAQTPTDVPASLLIHPSSASVAESLLHVSHHRMVHLLVSSHVGVP